MSKLKSKCSIIAHMQLILLASLLLAFPGVQASEITVRVAVHDDTQRIPLNPRAEIWARGLGSWWLARESFKDISGRVEGRLDQIVIYPDSRDGKEITVNFRMTSEMCPGGCARDMINVAIEDDQVVVEGYPIEAAYGELERVFPRR